LLLDAPDAEPAALNDVQDTEMQIDLEGRPNFAPEKNTV
jgi:hypothetical protein